jgi:DNA repair exonuclease SbcCD ATPase subunit
MTSENKINVNNTEINIPPPSYYSTNQQNDVRAALKGIDPILPGSTFLIGRTKYQRIIYFPESYEIGFRNFLEGNPLRVQIDLFTTGQLSNGQWVFLPSYIDGINDAENEFKFALLAEVQRRLFDENKITIDKLETQKKSYEDILADNEKTKDTLTKVETISNDLVNEKRRLAEELEKTKNAVERLQTISNDLVNEKRRLAEELEEQQNSAENYKEEKEEMQKQLNEIQRKMHEGEIENKETKNIEKKKASASPIH